MEAWKTPVMPPRMTKNRAPIAKSMGVVILRALFLRVRTKPMTKPSKGTDIAMVVKENVSLTPNAIPVMNIW
jgi:hypothetical protein